jgi:hypothetical protein
MLMVLIVANGSNLRNVEDLGTFLAFPTILSLRTNILQKKSC